MNGISNSFCDVQDTALFKNSKMAVQFARLPGNSNMNLKLESLHCHYYSPSLEMKSNTTADTGILGAEPVDS
ncbi:unnamed protein product [Absidia cylindrospora]